MSCSETDSQNDGQMNEIPIIDLAPLNLSGNILNFDPYKDLQADDPIIMKLAAEVVKAFSEIGFCYLINHAVSKQTISTFNKKAEEFFKLEYSVKSKYRHNDPYDPTGWQGLGEERVDEDKGFEGDYKQVYDIAPTTIKSWPEKETPGFKDAVLAMFQEGASLSLLTLKLMAIGLHLEDPDFFVKVHDYSQPSSSLIRAAYYPPIPKEIAERPGTTGCGEHSDWGSITLIFQDSVGGLEVMNRAGKYVPATPIKDSVVVNIGDMMQRWTADKLVSTMHRVTRPKVQHTRQTAGFFAKPMNEVSIECLDGSNKYPPISCYDYTGVKLGLIRGEATGGD